ncbi:MAG TPA: hypothetical protein VK166_10305 [Chitinophagaceae bacterium]|nr:hypothetical protein [Chitinophagaceae bacterium]
MEEKYLMPTNESGRDFMMRKISGEIVMLNLLRFREVADYTASPELAPENPISGEQAYQLYIEHTLPFLKASGGELVFSGKGGKFLIGPGMEKWDKVLLVRQKSVESFIAFEQNAAYMAGIGHRTAALEDSRLLPIQEDEI